MNFCLRGSGNPPISYFNRLRPPEVVVDEIAAVVRNSNSRHFFFVDSVFNDPREHALAVCRALARRRLPIRWMAFCNPVGCDAELAGAMAEAGCGGVEFGIDSATPKMLAALHKPFGQQEIRLGMQAVHDAGIPYSVHLLVGGPGVTWSDLEDTQRFLNDCAPANAIFAGFGIRVYQGTAIAAIAARENRRPGELDLFDPAYYVSPAMAENSEQNLDRIARRRPEWTSPMDWRRPLMRWIQKVMNLLDRTAGPVAPRWARWARRSGGCTNTPTTAW